MGRKVNPIGFRLYVNRRAEVQWFAKPNEFASLLHEDAAIRRFLFKELKQAGISKVEVDRFPTQMVVRVFTAKPGSVIGRKGEAIKTLRAGLERLTGKTVRLDVEEVTKPDLNAKLVADNITNQIERRVSHSRAIKRAIQQAMRQGALGIKIMTSGRLGGSDMSRREGQMEGRVPRSTLRSVIDYGTSEALTTFGRIGVKVWIYMGERAEMEEATITNEANA